MRGDVAALPLADGCADVVVAGEILEHVTDLSGTVAEACRVLRPGGLLVLDTLNATALSRLIVVTVGERMPGVPRGIHDPRLFVDPGGSDRRVRPARRRLEVRGARPLAAGPAALAAPAPRAHRTRRTIVPTRSTAVLYQGRGRKQG